MLKKGRGACARMSEEVVQELCKRNAKLQKLLYKESEVAKSAFAEIQASRMTVCRFFFLPSVCECRASLLVCPSANFVYKLSMKSF